MRRWARCERPSPEHTAPMKGKPMKTGKSITELAQEIQRQADSKRDFLVSTQDLRVDATPGLPVRLVVSGADDLAPLEIGATAHQQIATEAGIPKPYYDRMLAEQPELLARNVNTWFSAKPQRRMVRALDNRARALVSDKFRRLDNIELAEAALPALLESGMDIVSSEITERKLYIKAVDRSVQRFLPVGARIGDGGHTGYRIPNGEVVPAIQISNSEIGDGTLSVVGGYLDGGCTNLMWWWKTSGMKKYHVGARADLGDDLYKILTDETKSATDRALWLQFRDTVKAALSTEVFDERLEAVKASMLNEMVADPVKVVEVTAKRFGLSEGQRTSVLQHLIRGGHPNQFGLANAVTSMANDESDYDAASQFEALGGRIIELPKHEWKALSEGRELAKAA